MNSFCALCDTVLKDSRFSLKNTLTEYSKIPLISVIEDISETYFASESTQHLDICRICSELINEVDKLKIKLLEICNKIKRYLGNKNTKEQNKNIETLYDENISDNIISENVVLVENEIHLLSDVQTNSQVYEEDLLDREQINSINKTELKDVSPNDGIISKKKLLKRKKITKRENAPTSNELRNHAKNYNARPFVCEVCGQSYKQKFNFEVHMKIHQGINLFSCTYCNKSFTQKISLVRHLPLHTGDKPHQCETCGKRFIHHTSFISHKLIHTGTKSYKCPTCDESFRTSSHLKRHIRVHTGEKKFECTVCHRKFAEKYNLRVHHKLHINTVGEAPRKRKHSCQICGEAFERRLKLEEHKFKKHLSLFHDHAPETEINT